MTDARRFLHEDGILFAFSVGRRSLVDGVVVNARSIKVFVDGERLKGVRAIAAKRTDSGVVGDIEHHARRQLDPSPFDRRRLDVVVHHPESGEEVRRYTIANCTWVEAEPVASGLGRVCFSGDLLKEARP